MNNNHSMSIRNNDRNRNNMSFNRLPNIQRIYIGNISQRISDKTLNNFKAKNKNKREYKYSSNDNIYSDLNAQGELNADKKIHNKNNSEIDNNYQLSEFKISECATIYNQVKIEVEFYAAGMYFILILFQFFDFSLNQIADCFGRPVPSRVVINQKHYYLFIFLICFALLKVLVKNFLKRYFFKDYEDDYLPKLTGNPEYMTYVIFLYCCAIKLWIYWNVFTNVH